MPVKLACVNCGVICFVKPYRIRDGAKYCPPCGRKATVFRQGLRPWNKGKPIKLNDALTKWHAAGGRPWNTGLTGTPSGMKGKQHTLDSREKMRQRKIKNGHINLDGYRVLRILGRTVKEHRYIWEQAHGPIPSGFHVHHKNGDKLDNRIENLECLPNSEHQIKHWQQRRGD